MLTRRLMMQSALAAAVPDAQNSQKAAFKLLQDQALYLPLSEWYRTQLADNPASGPANAQPYAQRLAMHGDEVGAWRATRAAFGPPPTSDPPDLSAVQAVDAVEAVVRAARGKRVVAINDDHPTSLTRAFAHRLALRLAREGYDLMAAETFSGDESDFLAVSTSRGPVTSRIGYYTSDPVYAEMVRDLRDRGWSFAAYEQRPDQKTLIEAGETLSGVPAREEAQARNLAALIRAAPDRKVLIFCGEGHAAKLTSFKLMGARLAGMGVDFTSATQVTYLPAPDPADDGPFITTVIGRFHPTRPVALLRANGRPYETARAPGAYDVFIVHPHLPPGDGRPGWLAAAPGRKPASAELPAGLPAGALVQAVRRDEAAKAVNLVPSDQYPLPAAGVRRASCFLRPGAYLVRVETLEGRREVGRLEVG